MTAMKKKDGKNKLKNKKWNIKMKKKQKIEERKNNPDHSPFTTGDTANMCAIAAP